MADFIQLATTLHTERLTLTLFNPDNQEQCEQILPVLMYGQQAMAQYAPQKTQDLSPRERGEKGVEYLRTSGRISAKLLGGRTPTTAALWLVRLGPNAPKGQCIAIASVLHRSYLPDQGWMVAAEHQGKGYATEAATEVLRYFQEELGIHDLMVPTNAANVQSQHVATKLGYVQRERGLKLADGTITNLQTLPGAPLPPEDLEFNLFARESG